MQIARSLLAVSPAADSELMTTYVKFTVDASPQSTVFAAVWVGKQQAVDRRFGLARGLRSRGTRSFFCPARCTGASINTLWWSAVARPPSGWRNGQEPPIKTPCPRSLCPAFNLPRGRTSPGRLISADAPRFGATCRVGPDRVAGTGPPFLRLFGRKEQVGVPASAGVS